MIIWHSPYVAHKKPANVEISRKINVNFVCSVSKSNLHTINAPATGIRQ